MTETTSIDRMVLERRVYAPKVARRPNVTTVMAQVAVGYIAANFLLVWAVFLLTRWRQTPVALSFLKEEFRYYLID